MAHSLEELLSLTGNDDAVVIGGESIYRLLLPYCDTAIITKFDHEFESDAFIPNLDEASDWRLDSESEAFIAEPGTAFRGWDTVFAYIKKYDSKMFQFVIGLQILSHLSEYFYSIS